MRDSEKAREKIRVFLVDDHPVLLDALRSALTGPDMAVVGEARTGEEAVARIPELRPRVVVLDIRLPDMDGLAVLRLLKPKLPETSFVFFTAFEEPAYLTGAVAQGAAGFAIKVDETSDVVALVRRTATGEECLPRSYWAPLLRTLEAKKRTASAEVMKEWPERDVQILHFMGHGQGNARIAEILGLSPGNLRYFIKGIFARLGVSDRTHAVCTAIGRGILSPPTLKE